MHAWCVYKVGDSVAGEEVEGYGGGGLCKPCATKASQMFIEGRRNGEMDVDLSLSGDRDARA